MATLKEKYNDRLCSAIAVVNFLSVTARPITKEQFDEIDSLLSELRLDFHSTETESPSVDSKEGVN